LGTIVICPSNPFLSIDPILHTEGVRTRIAQNRAPVIANISRRAGAQTEGAYDMSGEIAVAEIEPDRSALMTAIRACWSLSAEL
jgi:2-phospho-L-lactate transferase/gluconeogenesis factor (CofD/UPF0052 family)